MTTGRLVRWAGYILLAGLVVSFVLTSLPEPWSGIGLILWFVTAGAVVLLLLAAGVAKVIEIGVRSARDDT